MLQLKNTFSYLIISLLIMLPLSCDNGDEEFDDSHLDGCCQTVPMTAEWSAAKAYLPNAFTPNADGFNDTFTVWGNANVVTVSSFTIIKGSTVFYEATNIAPNNTLLGWDGNIPDGTPAPDGVYQYNVSIVSLANTTFTHAGEVCLRSGLPYNCVDFEQQCAFATQHDGNGAYDPSMDSGEDCE